MPLGYEEQIQHRDLLLSRILVTLNSRVLDMFHKCSNELIKKFQCYFGSPKLVLISSQELVFHKKSLEFEKLSVHLLTEKPLTCQTIALGSKKQSLRKE